MKQPDAVAAALRHSSAGQLAAVRAGDYQVRIDTRSGTPTLQLSLSSAPENTAVAVRSCPRWDGKPVTIDVASTFAEGETLRDFYSGQTAQVSRENHAAARRRQRRPVAAGIRRHGETGGVQLA